MDPSKNPKEGQDDHKSDDDSYLEDMLDSVLSDDAIEDEKRDGFELETLLDNPTGATLDTRQFDERDYQSHRRESFPHTRHLHSSGAHHQQHQGSSNSSSSRRASSSSRNEGPGFTNILSEELESLVVSSVVSPVVNPYQDLTESPPKKVQFEIGGESGSGTFIDPNEHPHERKKHHRRHHHHHHPRGEDQVGRPRQGSLTLSPPMVPSDTEFGSMDDLDQENLSSHRFSDNKGYRRHRYLSRLTGNEIGSEAPKPVKYDHQPHEIFVELDVLSGHGEHREWKEAARWIKYEEDVEEGADRWGRPHVASLSFHSLINLRRLIETGVTLLDLEERDLPGVVYRAVEAMVVQELIRPEDRAMVMRALLLKHKHVNENEGLWKFNLRRNTTTSGSLTSLHAMLEQDRSRSVKLGSPSTVPEGLSSGGPKMPRRNSAASRLINDANSNDRHHEITIEDDSHTPLNHHSGETKLSLSNLSEDDVKWITNKDNLLRRIPIGAEASIVLVGKDEKLKRPIMVFIRLASSSFMPNITELPIPVRFIYFLLGPSSYDLDYKEIGRSISTLMSNRHFHEIAYKANDRRDMLKGIHEFLDESIVLPPGDWDNELFPFEEMKEKSQMLRKRTEKRRQSSIAVKKGLLVDDGDGNGPPDGSYSFDPQNPLQRTKRLFGGMINDVRRRYKLYVSDIRDGLTLQVLASIIFIYFACVSGAIAFGGILGKKTDMNIGISETLIASSAAGILFSLFSGQPLIIVGVTAPLLVFDESLYKICKSNDIDFLAFRFWIGIWIMAIGMVVVCFDGSCIARYLSRFIQEIYSALISLLFIYETISNLAKIYASHPLQMEYGKCTVGDKPVPCPNTALLSTVLCLGTFVIAYALRAVRVSGYFTPSVRKFLGNFAVPIAIVVMVGLDYGLAELTETAKLDVPDGLSNSKPRTSWFVDVSPISVSVAVLAVVPAALVFILIFLETCICSLIVSKKEMKLKKGGGYHLDIFLICVINGAVASIGGCWICAATVRAVAHASSLTVYSTNNPPGEKPSIVGVKEQRVSNVMISILIGLSVMISPALKLIPLSVLFGVFLYMGISSMSGVQFFERVSLLFKQVSSHPQVPYVRRVRTSRMHIFTIIQILCLVVLFGMKLSPGALGMPFIIVLLIPLRLFVLKYFFKPSELAALDGKGDDEEHDLASKKPSLDTLPILTLKEHIHRSTPEKTALMDNTDMEDESPETPDKLFKNGKNGSIA